jgi:hypothetical protein
MFKLCCGNEKNDFLFYADENGELHKYTLVQYLFKGKEHMVDADVPHGNSKKDRGYKRVMASTRKALQTQHPSSKKSPKEILDAVYLDVGDVTKA